MSFSASTNNLVSVIIPCFNQGIYLGDAINSVLASTYTPIEIIIVDDGSTDDTATVSDCYANLFQNIKYYYQPNRGPSVARNYGITKARGQWILPLDADDKIAEDYISRAVQVLQQQPEVKLVYCNASFFGFKEGPWKLKEFSLKRLALRNMIFNCALYRKRDWEKAGGYAPELIHGFEDWEFWISLLKDKGTVHKLDITGFYYRIHQQSRRRSTARKYKKHCYDFISRKHLPFLQQQLYGPIRSPKKLTIPLNRLLRFIEMLSPVPVKALTNRNISSLKKIIREKK